ncbi:MAG: hypothetical protein K0R93_520 [Anaerosolibacter sp.]|jgi:hypothetical protein|uniref:stalk domain-containing protein n=1 Tax=Anaerosolibacter sp. TaxID=1872527 RepID=UPI00260E7A0D|nr:stalk domain-containing protein [Anaerosolibacter sp.]MDF2545622.1 hypothetical protein [Anaerosolibacter sp.]
MKRKSKKLMSSILITAMLAVVPTFVSANTNSEIEIYINGVKQTYDTVPMIKADRTLVPMRGIFEDLGAEITWDESNRTVKAVKEDIEIELKIDSHFAKKNGETIQMEVQPFIYENRTMIPLRFVSEALGADVAWQGDTRTVNIATKKADTNAEAGDTIPSKGNVITYDDAIKRAIERNYELKNKEAALEKAEIKYDNVYLSPGFYNPTLIQAKKGLATSQEWAEKEVTLTKEAIEYQVTNTMNEINMLKSEAALFDKKIANGQTKLKIATLKAETGLESQFNLDLEKKALEQLEKQKEILDKTISNSFIKLDQMIGLPEKERPAIEDKISYRPMEAIDIDHLARTASYEDPYIWSLEKQIESAELGITLYEYNVGNDPYAVKEIDVKTAKNNLAESKEKLQESLKTRYNQAKKLEGSYDILEINLGNAEKSLGILRVQFDLGMATEMQLRNVELDIEQLKHDMKDMAEQHRKLVKIIEKPYLAPDYL